MKFIVMRKAKRKNARWRKGSIFTDIESARKYATDNVKYYTKICYANYKLIEVINEK